MAAKRLENITSCARALNERKVPETYVGAALIYAAVVVKEDKRNTHLYIKNAQAYIASEASLVLSTLNRLTNPEGNLEDIIIEFKDRITSSFDEERIMRIRRDRGKTQINTVYNFIEQYLYKSNVKYDKETQKFTLADEYGTQIGIFEDNKMFQHVGGAVYKRFLRDNVLSEEDVRKGKVKITNEHRLLTGALAERLSELGMFTY